MVVNKIFKTLTFGKDTVDIIAVTARQYSIAMGEYCDYELQRQKDRELKRTPDDRLDVYPFFIANFCLFNGKKKEIDFILKLQITIYTDIIAELGKLINKEE